jgi:hypothetical protein
VIEAAVNFVTRPTDHDRTHRLIKRVEDIGIVKEFIEARDGTKSVKTFIEPSACAYEREDAIAAAQIQRRGTKCK